jgi:hypothetical protein
MQLSAIGRIRPAAPGVDGADRALAGGGSPGGPLGASDGGTNEVSDGGVAEVLRVVDAGSGSGMGGFMVDQNTAFPEPVQHGCQKLKRRPNSIRRLLAVEPNPPPAGPPPPKPVFTLLAWPNCGEVRMPVYPPGFT